MSFVIRALVVVGILVIYVSAVPSVTVLPFGADSALQNFSNYAYHLFDIFWFLAPIWTYAMYILYIELLIFAWRWFKHFLNWI